jgi:hypothetical protein
MKTFLILAHSLESLQNYTSNFNVIKQVSNFIVIEWNQEIENLCLLHDISMFTNKFSSL